jgi:hypothetical protein
MSIALSPKTELQESLFPLQRKIDSIYQKMPWPQQITKVVVMTDVLAGLGDIASAAKVIGILQRISEKLLFEWVTKYGGSLERNASFLADRARVTLRNSSDHPTDSSPVELVLVGPVKYLYKESFLESSIMRKIAGPIFGFMEYGEKMETFGRFDPETKVKNSKDSVDDTYKKMHRILFPAQINMLSRINGGLLPMGIHEGTGVLLDPERLHSPLSRIYCCPSYLSKIEDCGLLSDIRAALGCSDEGSLPNYDTHSFNSGYAHRKISWAMYIECVAIHEREKHVVIVLNQNGAYDEFTPKRYWDEVFTHERCAYLGVQGYSSIVLKAEADNDCFSQKIGGNGRSLTVIIRPFIHQNDFKQIQLASERLMATGDNSAAEAWCARCKLFLYENVDNGCKAPFVRQQVQLAETFSPNLAMILHLFGTIRRGEWFNCQSFRTEMEGLLSKPEISDDTLTFCQKIAQDYSFEPVLQGAIKRAVWHHVLPELQGVEAEAMDPEFRSGVINFLREGKSDVKLDAPLFLLQQAVHDVIYASQLPTTECLVDRR